MVKENQILKEQEKKENEDKRRQSIVELEQNTSLPPEVEVQLNIWIVYYFVGYW